jgi:hypothetical protein
MLSKTDISRSPADAYCPDCEQWWDTTDKPGCEVSDMLDNRVICPDCADSQGYAACEGCGTYHDDLVDCDGTMYCLDCADKNDFKECESCHTWHSDCVDCDGDTNCIECAEASDYHSCDHCNDWFSGDDLNNCGDNVYCDRCASRNGWVKCEGCDEWTRESMTGSDGNDYCDSCWCDRFFVCDSCGDTYDNDDYEGEGLCSSCYRRNHNDHNFDALRFSHDNNSYNRIGHRKFGVEIETSSCEDYCDLEDEFYFGAKDDGSISGKEFVSSVLSGDKGLDAIMAFCNAADDKGFTVNRSCGLHVHFDMREENTESMKSIYCAMRFMYDVWKHFVDSDRRSRHYCEADTTELSDIFGVTDWACYAHRKDRYKWLNINAYVYHSTFEVRLYHGTCNGKEICNWIRGLSLFIDWAARNDWRIVRNTLLAKSPTQKWEFLCKLWEDCNASDLVDYYIPIVARNGLTVREEVAV